MKKLSVLLLGIIPIACLTGCSTNNQNNNLNDGDEIENAMVVYFSATNNTEAVAQSIARHINAKIYELEPRVAYTSADLNYGNSDSRVVQEHNQIVNGNRVNVELVETHFEGFEDAEYIFLGAPVWWQELSWVIESFVSENDFEGKTIIPFGTSSSSSFTLDNLTPLATNATWLEPQRFRSRVPESEVISWVDGLDITFA